jgi:hypothetical protein
VDGFLIEALSELSTPKRRSSDFTTFANKEIARAESVPFAFRRHKVHRTSALARIDPPLLG